jgi:hypothetical protein
VGNRTVDRAIEFFMPVGQSGESQQWITSSMRLLSLAARGGFLERALSDMRKVAWDRGPVRLGTHRKDDGTLVPMWHDSEVAAMAYAIQNILARRVADPVQQQLPLDEPTPPPVAVPQAMAGKKCSECGAHAVIRKDGCDYCTQCGHMGSCWWLLAPGGRWCRLRRPVCCPPCLRRCPLRWRTRAAMTCTASCPCSFTGFPVHGRPKWLGVRALEAPQLRAPLVLLATSWGLWVTGSHVHARLAAIGLTGAVVGLGWIVGLFWRLIAASTAEDRLHAKVIGVGGIVGWLSLAGACIAVWLDAAEMGRAFVLTGLWGFVVVTYVTVAHRMIPFFTSSAVPMVEVWRPFWALWVMLAAAALEVVSVWVELSGVRPAMRVGPGCWCAGCWN